MTQIAACPYCDEKNKVPPPPAGYSWTKIECRFCQCDFWAKKKSSKSTLASRPTAGVR